jgi:hypothetical protein
MNFKKNLPLIFSKVAYAKSKQRVFVFKNLDSPAIAPQKLLSFLLFFHRFFPLFF